MDSTSRISLHTGRQMPVMGLGTWLLTDDTAATVEEALASGYRMIDTAVDYGSQPGIGEAIRNSDIDRQDIFVVTKIEEDDDPRGGIERDLSELQLDYADLTLIHRPPFLCDAERCIECNAYATVCKNEHEVPWGMVWRRVVTINDGQPGEKSIALSCMHCTDAPCVAVCPTSTLYQTDIGVVLRAMPDFG